MIAKHSVDLSAPASRPTIAAADLNLAVGLPSTASDISAGQRTALVDAAFGMAETECRRLWGERDFTALIEVDSPVKLYPAGGWLPRASSVSTAELVGDDDRLLTLEERTLDQASRLTLPEAGIWQVTGSVGEDITASGWELPNGLKEAVLRLCAFYLREGYLRTGIEDTTPISAAGGMNKCGAALFLREYKHAAGREWWPA